MAIEVGSTAQDRVEGLLYQWGEECQSTAERLGMPASSGIARMIEQQRVFERGLRGTRRRRKAERPQTVQIKGASVLICPSCKTIVVGGCGVCDRKEAGESRLHGTPTRSLKPPPMSEFSSTVADIEAIVRKAPGWVQQCLMLSYLWLLRDSKAAQRLRIRTSKYTEGRLASLEYVADRLQFAYKSA